jgi:beta-phosphoglucomutase-like phosphatase (HAD superfamily)
MIVCRLVANFRANDPDETVVIEDSVAGVTAAKRAGMKAVGFTGDGHAYELLHTRFMGAGADQVCSSMVEVVDLLA